MTSSPRGKLPAIGRVSDLFRIDVFWACPPCIDGQYDQHCDRENIRPGKHGSSFPRQGAGASGVETPVLQGLAQLSQQADHGAEMLGHELHRLLDGARIPVDLIDVGQEPVQRVEQ